MHNRADKSAVALFLAKEVDLTRLFKYFFVGATAALVDWLLYWALVKYGTLHYLLAAMLSFIASTAVNYILSIKWVFRSGRHNRYVEIGLVFFVSLIGLLFNELFLYIFADYFRLHYMISKVAATGIVFFWNYLSRKKFIFN